MPGKKGCNCVDEIVLMISNAFFLLKGMIGNASSRLNYISVTVIFLLSMSIVLPCFKPCMSLISCPSLKNKR